MAAPYPYLGAFESTKIHGSGQDVLGTTRHDRRWRHDLDLLRHAGIMHLRYSAPWHRIEAQPGVFSWDWFDAPMQYMEAHGMDPILDPLHHTSFPDWLDGGFANPLFPDLYSRFLTKLRERYPWATRYTLFNEPLPTTLLCSHMGVWYPHHRSDGAFVRMAVNVARAICQAAAAVSRLGPVSFIHIDTAEWHQAHDRQSIAQAAFCNERRYLLHDLILGRVSASHPLYGYLKRNGFDAEDIRWFVDNQTHIDVLGLDYYPHSELHWYWSHERRQSLPGAPKGSARGFHSIAQDYVVRFHRPIMLTETNIRGTVTDRLTWLKLMGEECESLAKTSDFRGFCWYPSIDSTDWCHLCAHSTASVDPQGIWWLDEARWERRASELSDCYTALAQGELSPAELPAYDLSPEAARLLRPYESTMDSWPQRLTPVRDGQAA